MYRDRWIECTPDEIRIRGYYFPWGTKRIPYRSIRGFRRVDLSAARGRGRIWGTAEPALLGQPGPWSARQEAGADTRPWPLRATVHHARRPRRR